MQFEYRTKGTCSQRILFEVEDGVLRNVQFIGGCNGNLKGIAALVEGMDIDDAISRLDGILCRNGTSCPNELAQGIKDYYKSK